MIMKHSIRLTWLALSFSFVFSHQAIAQDLYQRHLSQGHEFFKNKQFEKSLFAYQTSYSIEPLDSTLYNIAVSYFKLKNWQQALFHFEELKQYQGSSDIVDYNIGVSHKKLNQHKKALHVFEELYASAEDEKFALLAEQQITLIIEKNNKHSNTSNNQLESTLYGSTKQSTPNNNSDYVWQNMLRAQYGQDNNISLPDDDTVQNEADGYIDLSFNSTWMSSQNLKNAWLLDFTYFKSKYNENSEYDIDLYALSGRKYFSPQSLKNYRFWLGLSYDNVSLSSENYISNTTFTLGGDYKLNRQSKLSIEYSQKHINDGDEQYYYLAGTTNRFKLTWKQKTDNGYWRTGLKYYLNDRNDRTVEETYDRRTFTEYTSYSADRTTLFLSRLWTLDDWEFSADLQYRFSQYNNQNTIIEYNDNDLPSGTTSLGVREDNRYSFLADVTYNITDDLSIGAEFDISSNTSTIETYDYSQSSFAIGVNWVF
jgi:hypothetical protein